MNKGPNAITYTRAPELFPIRLRSSASGFAKIGAVMAIFFMPILKNEYSLTKVLELMALLNLPGFLVTQIFSEKIEENKTLEQRHQPDI